MTGLTAIATNNVLKDVQKILCVEEMLGIHAGTYHANMEPEDKTKAHTQWSANELQVVVATVTFGMGIDKPDVRFLIHHSMSKSMENYYQESGRAGRYDLRADCILYYGSGDMFKISSMVVMENVGQQELYEMVSHCQNISKCRRVLIAKHLDELWTTDACNKMCDNCCKDVSFEKKNVTQHCRDLIKILKQAEGLNERLTPLKLIGAWMGKGAAKFRVAGIAAPAFPREDLEKILAHALLQQYLKDCSFMAYATISYLKVRPRASLLSNEAHAVTMHMKSAQSSVRDGSSEACQLEQVDWKGEEKKLR